MDDPRPPLFEHLSLLSEPTRVRLLRLLEQEELGVGELSSIVQLPQSTVSRHLKALITKGWVERRSEGTSSLVRMVAGAGLGPGGLALWGVVREACDGAAFAADRERMQSILAQRRVDTRAYFGRVAGSWGQIRSELFGASFTLPTMLALLPPDWVVGDLGCGTAEAAAVLAPAVKGVIAVDNERAMLGSAQRRLDELALDNVELRQGELTALPIADNELDAAVMVLVLHHLPDPAAALREARRTIRGAGPLVVLDMVAHRRTDYRRRMGHQHLGFSPTALAEHARAAGQSVRSLRVLPADPDAQGPPLFVATLNV